MISTSIKSAVDSLEEKNSWLQRPLLDQLPFVTPEFLIISLIMVLAVFSRFYILGDRVMSHDETNHVVPSYSLYQGKGYQHDPVTHGPFQFHIVALSYFLFGASDFTSRVPSALFSIATVFFAWWGYRRYLGRTGALAASVMMLISPFILFYGRYTRNESFIGLSMVVMVYAVLRYLETGRFRYLTLFTGAILLHFISKETSFIYSAQVLIFLAGLFVYQVARKPWKNPASRQTFLFGVIACAALLGLAAGAYLLNKPVVPAVPAATVAAPGAATGSAASTPSPLPVLTVVLGGLAAFDLILTLVFLARGFGIAAVRQERSFDLLVLLGTLVLPQLSPFPVKFLGWNPLDYSEAGAIHSAIFIVILVVLAVGIGLWWRPRIWLANAALFYAVFVTFYTTFFTNGQGFLTGLVGALGYWLSQQSVDRGSQPLYYYALIQIPMYEYLPAIGTLLAFVLALRHPDRSSITADPAPAGAAAAVNEEIPETEVTEITPNGLNGQELEEAGALSIPVESAVLQPDRVPFVWFLLFWAATALAAFSIAGEKMPWLTFHITLPMILVSGWSIGYLIDTTPWKPLLKDHLGLTFLLLPVFFFGLGSLAVTITGNHPPFQGKELAQIQDTLTFLSAFLAAFGSLAALFWLTRRWSGFQMGRAFLVALFAVLAVQTARTAIRSSFINYDTAKEYLVYAHAARGPKDVLAEVEEISRRTTGSLDIAVAYDNDTLYPFWWYFRDYPNKVYYGPNPTRDLRNDPVILVGETNYGKIEPIVGSAYVSYETMRLWWPNQDYFNLTWDRVRGALTNPDIRAGIWQIWWNADYTQYAKATNEQTDTLTTWQPSNKMRVYIRKDIAAQIWKYGATPAAVQADPYEKGTIKLSADKTIGGPGTEPGQFQYPHGIAVAPDGSLYVADARNHRIQHFAADGTLLLSWGSFADVSKGAAPGGTFDEPWDVAVATDGSVFVADTWNNRIQKFTTDGKFVKMWGYFGQGETPDAFWGPRGLAINPKNQLLVTDTGNKRVAVFDLDGNPVTSFGVSGSQQGQLNEPVGIAVDSSGKVFIADTWNQRIQVFQPDAAATNYSYLKEWDISGWYGQSLDNKPYLAVDSQGDVFATDPEANRVLEFDNNGTFLRAWGDYGTGPDGFNLAAAPAVDAQGGVWISDAGNNRLLHFTLPK